LRAVERFLRDGTPMPRAARALPPPLQQLALQAALAVRWRRWGDRVRHNMIAFLGVDSQREARRLLGGLSATMAEVACLGCRPHHARCRADDLLGWHELDAAAASSLGRGRGLVVASAHLGYWHLPLHLLAGRAPVWLMDPWPATLRPLSPMGPGRSAAPASRPFPARPGQTRASHARMDGWTLALEALDRNEIVAVLPDLPRRGGRSEAVTLMGRQVRVAAAPAVICHLTGAPLLPVLCALDAGRASIATSEPIEAAWDAVALAGPSVMMQRLAEVFSAAIRDLPGQWLGWIHPWAEPVRPRARPLAPAHRSRVALVGA
jgi:lauroyl/myristoyl acyltransferase